jgi:hypothetical protein
MNQVQIRNCLLEVPYCVGQDKSCEDCLSQENEWAKKWLDWYRRHS